MRCPDCNKYVGFDELQVEVQDENLEVQDVGDGEVDVYVSCSVRAMLPCIDCGTELKETTFELEGNFQHKCSDIDKEMKVKQKAVANAEMEQFEYEFNAEPFDYFSPPNAKPRYQKHIYGVDVTMKAVCQICGEEITVEMKDELQSSGFDELV